MARGSMAETSIGAHLLTPTLTHIADFLVEVGAPIIVGESAQGLRRVAPITGGVIHPGNRLGMPASGD
jgi:hypothetical protein